VIQGLRCYSHDTPSLREAIGDFCILQREEHEDGHRQEYKEPCHGGDPLGPIEDTRNIVDRGTNVSKNDPPAEYRAEQASTMATLVPMCVF
jgi:hypothetical protein